jgi:invasion protein IalB
MTAVYPARPRRAATCITALTALTLGGSLVVAQAQPQPAPQVPAPKATPRPVAPKQQPKQQQPAQQAPAEQQATTPSDMPPIVQSPWTKFCGKEANNPQAKDTCMTLREVRLETGQLLVGAALVEPEGEAKKTLRVTVPLLMQIPVGTRLVLDQEPAIPGHYVVCTPNGCVSDHEVNAEFVGKLKKGKQLVVQAINIQGQQANFPLLLADFAKANEGPAVDPKAFEEQQKKLQEELQRRAEEARKKLQSGSQPK